MCYFWTSLVGLTFSKEEELFFYIVCWLLFDANHWNEGVYSIVKDRRFVCSVHYVS